MNLRNAVEAKLFLLSIFLVFFSFLLLTEKSSNSKKGKLLLWGKRGEKNQGQTKVNLQCQFYPELYLCSHKTCFACTLIFVRKY